MGMTDNERDMYEAMVEKIAAWVNEVRCQPLDDVVYEKLIDLKIDCVDVLMVHYKEFDLDALCHLIAAYRKHDYIESEGGSGCPFCGQDPDDSPDAMLDEQIQRHCEECGKDWNDLYQLIGIEEQH